VAKHKRKRLDTDTVPLSADLADWWIQQLCDLAIQIRKSPWDRGLRDTAASLSSLAKASHAFTSTIELQTQLIEIAEQVDRMQRGQEYSAGIDHTASGRTEDSPQ